MTHKYACYLDSDDATAIAVVVEHSDAPWEAARKVARRKFGGVADERVTVKYLSSDSRSVQIESCSGKGYRTRMARRREMERVL